MVKISHLDDVGDDLRSFLNAHLKTQDEAVVLPGASKSMESAACKGVVFRLKGTEPNVAPEIFGSNWFAGCSIVHVASPHIDDMLRDPAARAAALTKLADAIPSEMHDVSLTVGPRLDAAGDQSGRDGDEWTAGFDGPACSVGLYAALESRPPSGARSNSGMQRPCESYYLVCKAGAGVAAQTFHTRLMSSLKRGATLDEALAPGGSPGAEALARVAAASSRNRRRLLAVAAQVLGIHSVDTVSDHTAAPSSTHRLVVPSADIFYNTLVRDDAHWRYAAGCCDCAVSNGCIVSSNAAEGFIAFSDSNGLTRVPVRNNVQNCLTFSTPRSATAREAITRASSAHKEHGAVNAHPDASWISTRFAWRSKDFGARAARIEPPALWGSHAPEIATKEWARELGVSRLSTIRLQPLLVALSAPEPGKLRVCARALK